jgi:hypothetical protein
LEGVALFTKPSTAKSVQIITGKTETFVVETARHEELGDTIFIECMDERSPSVGPRPFLERFRLPLGPDPVAVHPSNTTLKID